MSKVIQYYNIKLKFVNSNAYLATLDDALALWSHRW